MTTTIDKVLLSDDASLKVPDVSRLTTQSLAGTGVFDIMMATTKLHLKEEYNAGRITGEEYTTVYLGAMQSVMQNSVQFLLNFQQEEKIQSEIALVRQKTVTELANTDNTIPTGLGFNGGIEPEIEGLVALTKAKIELENLLITAQTTNTIAQADLTDQKLITETAQTTTASAGLIKAQQDKLNKETVLIEQKVVTEVAQTSDTKPEELGEMSSTDVIGGLAKTAREKVAAEKILLLQKANTELAQTDDVVKATDPYLNSDSEVAGVIGKQKALFEAQTKGFYRDAEQKAAKIMTEAWSIDASSGDATRTNESTVGGGNLLDDPSVGEVIAIMKAGITTVV